MSIIEILLIIVLIIILLSFVGVHIASEVITVLVILGIVFLVIALFNRLRGTRL